MAHTIRKRIEPRAFEKAARKHEEEGKGDLAAKCRQIIRTEMRILELEHEINRLAKRHEEEREDYRKESA